MVLGNFRPFALMVLWLVVPGLTACINDTQPDFTIDDSAITDLSADVAVQGAIDGAFEPIADARSMADATADAARPADVHVSPPDPDGAVIPDGHGFDAIGQTDAAPPPPAACADGVDNDADGRIDASDPGCTSALDNDETDGGITSCSDGVDNDGDGFVDYPDDDECAYAGQNNEGATCAPGLPIVEIGPEGGEHRIIPADGGAVTAASCGEGVGRETALAITVAERSNIAVSVVSSPLGAAILLHGRALCGTRISEIACRPPGSDRPLLLWGVPAGTYHVFVQWADRNAVPVPLTATIDIRSAVNACSDGVDNDDDDLVDLADPGCPNATGLSEIDPPDDPACADGDDNDGDDQTDWPEDPDCQGAGDPSEGPLCEPGVELIELGTGGGRVELTLDEEAPRRFRSRCGGTGPERIVVVTLDRPARVVFDVIAPDLSAALSLRAACDAAAPEVACTAIRGDGRLTLDRLDPGSWFLAVDANVPARALEPTLVEVWVTVDPLDPAACADGEDNDLDGLIDEADPGCLDSEDRDELDPQSPAACADGVDNDEDGAIDWPADAQCLSAGSVSERGTCRSHGLDIVTVGPQGGQISVTQTAAAASTRGSCVDAAAAPIVVAMQIVERSMLRVAAQGSGGGAAIPIYIRADCDDPEQELVCGHGLVTVDDIAPGDYYLLFSPPVDQGSLERVDASIWISSLVRACNDEVDNDGDGLIDAADPGCLSTRDADEANAPEVPVCADAIDNDEDGLTDWPDDPDCQVAGGASEALECGDDLTVLHVGPQSDRVHVELPGGRSRAAASCAQERFGSEVVLAVTLAERSDLAVGIEEPQRGIALYGRSQCNHAATELGCREMQDQGNEFLRLNDLAAGTHFIFVDESRGQPRSVDVYVDIASAITECNDGLDNDDDGRVDTADPGCEVDRDRSEQDPLHPPECADGADNDDDGLIDWPDDTTCRAAGGRREAPYCEQTDDVVELGPEGGVVHIDTQQQEHHYQASCVREGEAPEQVVALRLERPSQVAIETVAANYDTVLYVRSDCELAERELACDDDGGEHTMSRIVLGRLEPGTYFIFVDGFGRAFGTTDLIVGVDPLE